MPQFLKYLALPLAVAVAVLAYTAGGASACAAQPSQPVAVIPLNSDDGFGGMTTAQAEATVGTSARANLGLDLLAALNLDLALELNAELAADINANAGAGIHV